MLNREYWNASSLISLLLSNISNIQPLFSRSFGSVIFNFILSSLDFSSGLKTNFISFCFNTLISEIGNPTNCLCSFSNLSIVGILSHRFKIFSLVLKATTNILQTVFSAVNSSLYPQINNKSHLITIYSLNFFWPSLLYLTLSS